LLTLIDTVALPTVPAVEVPWMKTVVLFWVAWGVPEMIPVVGLRLSPVGRLLAPTIEYVSCAPANPLGARALVLLIA